MRSAMDRAGLVRGLPPLGSMLLVSAAILSAQCESWRSAYPVGGSPSSFFSICEECSLKMRSNHSGHCCCTPLLDIRCERLSTIPEFSSEVPLTYSGIYMSDQEIAEIPDMVFQNFKVRKIVLNFNPIHDNLSHRALRGLESTIQELHLGFCKISYLPDGFLEKMEALRYLHLWQNSIEKIPPSFFKDCSSLRELILWGNKIKNIDSNTFAGLRSLRKLDLDRNKVTSVPKDAFRHMRELEVLHLGENMIKILNAESFIHVAHLKVLNLDGNLIERVDPRAFLGLRNLIALSLNGNRIRHLQMDTFNNLSNMTSIALRNNRLEDIWPKTFEPMRKLQSIDLSRNRLAQIRDNTFSAAQRLRYLYLEENSLKTLNKCILSKNVTLQTISLFGNYNFECDCRVTWLLDMYERDGVKVWGTCGKAGKFVAPTAIVSRFQYKLIVCKNSPVECKR